MSLAGKIINEVIEEHAGEIGTHHAECYKYHAACLAVLLGEVLEARQLDEAGIAKVIDRAILYASEQAGLSNHERWEIRDEAARAVIEFLGERHASADDYNRLRSQISSWITIALDVRSYGASDVDLMRLRDWIDAGADSEMPDPKGERHEPEPVASQPSEDARERIAAILQLRHPGNMYSTCERDADAILAAGFSRATVPDAATERERSDLWQSLDWMLWGVGMGNVFREPLADKMIRSLSDEEFDKAQDLIRGWDKLRGGPIERNLFVELKAERDEALARLAEAERAAAEKAIKALEIELVGSMDDGTFTAPWVEIPAGEIREKIWAVFDSYGAAALGLTAEQEGEKE